MPYIKAADRQIFDEDLEVLQLEIRTLGELNYCITRLTLGYIGSDLDYATFSGVIGTLRLVAAELERRAIAPYEDNKIIQNTDVPEYERIDRLLLTDQVQVEPLEPK